MAAARDTWRRGKRLEGKCVSCGEADATAGDRCDDCAHKNRAAARAAHHRSYVRRSAVGIDGRRHYRCRNCNQLGHQAKKCHEIPAVTMEREELPSLSLSKRKRRRAAADEAPAFVVRLSCLCGERMAGPLSPEEVDAFRIAHAGHARPRKGLHPEQFALFSTEAA